MDNSVIYIGERLISSALPEGGIVVALVEFYADESESGMASGVSGYVYTSENAIALHKEWVPQLKGLNFFHMKDVTKATGPYKGRSDLSEIEIALVALINKYASCSYTVSIDLNYRGFLPSATDIGLKQLSPHTFCCYWLLYNLRSWINKNYPDAMVAYHFEGGGQHQKQTNALLSALYKNSEQREFFKIASWQFVDKLFSGAVQGADILAWNWTKFLKDRMEISGREPRKDLIALIQNKEKNFSTHFDPQVISGFLKTVGPYSRIARKGS